MTHRLHLAMLAATASIVVASAPAGANPGILHKHAHRAIGAPPMLPGQMSGVRTASPNTSTAAGTASVTNAPGAADGPGIACGLIAPAVEPGMGVDGAALIAMPVLPQDGGTPIHMHHHPGAVPGSPGVGVVGGCVVMPPAVDGVPVNAMPVDGVPVVGMPVDGMPIDGVPVDGLPVDGLPVDGLPVDGLPVDGTVSSVAPVLGFAAAPGFVHAWSRGRDGGGVQPLASGMMMASNAAGVATTANGATDVAGVSASARAGGLPAQAAGVRSDTISEARFYRHGPTSAAGNTSTVSNAAPAGSAQTPSAHAARVGAVTPAVGAAGGTAPRWRDRLRVAWPGSK